MGVADATVRSLRPDIAISGARSLLGVTRANSAAGENGDDRALDTPSAPSPCRSGVVVDARDRTDGETAPWKLLNGPGEPGC